MSPWDWITSTTSVDTLFTSLGLGTLAILFATNRIITRGQHLDRIADLNRGHEREMSALESHHSRELAEAHRHVERVDESRREWKVAEGISRDRADKATATIGEMAESLEGVRHVLESLNTAAKDSGHDRRS